MPIVEGADLTGTAFGNPIDLRFDRPYRASPTGLLRFVDIVPGSLQVAAALSAEATAMPMLALTFQLLQCMVRAAPTSVLQF
eukprot:6203517-Pleurochrysis_carterae.AAC.4